MSLDEDIKAAFARHQDDVIENGASVQQARARAVRAYRRRSASIGGALLALLVAAALALPKIAGDEPRGFATDPPTPTPSMSEGTTPEGQVYRNERDGYQTLLPKDWGAGEFEAVVEFVPPGHVGLTPGKPTFAVEVQVLYGQQASGTEAGLEFREAKPIDGRAAYFATEAKGDGEHRDVWRIEWPVPGCSGSCALRIMVFGSTAELWDQYDVDGRTIVDHLRASGEPDMAGPVLTRRGDVGADVPYDEATAALVKFMDARCDGGGAEPFMTQNAVGDIQQLYGTGDPPNGWLQYRILSRAEADASSFEYEIAIETKDGDTVISRRETIGVGRAEGDYLVRFAQAHK